MINLSPARGMRNQSLRLNALVRKLGVETQSQLLGKFFGRMLP
jgi:hypothetical protein